MLVPLKPLSIDSNSKQLDSKQKKYHASVERALEHFDSVTEWADYIASLGKLLKALQSWSPQFQNVKYYVPYPYQVSRRLSSSLSPNLPSGVHQKTLEVYNFIFQKIGIEALSRESNIWIPGILPLMSYASISVKSPLIDLYENYLVQLESSIQRILIKPILASLFPGIDDESSEFQSSTLALIDSLRENLADDALFWQSCFMVIISNKERRMGGLVWLTKKLPSLNAVPHKVAKKALEHQVDEESQPSFSDKKQIKEEALELLLPTAKPLVSPDPGLLIRCLVSCLYDENELLIKRGTLDLLLQRIHLDSPVLQILCSETDRKLLMVSCCKTMLSRDMSISRRIWNWLLGPSSASVNQQQSEQLKDYFPRYGLDCLMSGLFEMFTVSESLPDAFRICLSLMDRWEIASLMVPRVFLPLMQAARQSNDNSSIIRSASAFFDTIETGIIWGKLFDTVNKDKDYSLLKFVLANFNIGSDEEVVIRHLPLIFLTLLPITSSESQVEVYELLNILVDMIPERAYLPIKHSRMKFSDVMEQDEVLDRIGSYYRVLSDPLQTQNVDNSNDLTAPFSTEDLTLITVEKVHSILVRSLTENSHVNQASVLFVKLVEKIPESASDIESQSDTLKSWLDDGLIEAVFGLRDSLAIEASETVFGVVELYSNYLAPRMPILQSVKLLKIIVISLWSLLTDPNMQMEAVRCLDALRRSVDVKYIESALAYTLLKEPKISQRLSALDALWIHLENNISVTRRPLELILDELFDKQNPKYLNVSKWILSIINSGSANRLFQILTENLLRCGFLEKQRLDELDDIDIFSYHVQTLTNVLSTNGNQVVAAFSTELTSVQSLDMWKGEDISTYKNLVLALLLRFLRVKNNTSSKSIRSSLILMDILVDGTEHNFKDIVAFLLASSLEHISSESQESELISVSLLNIVSKVLSLSHQKVIQLDVIGDDKSRLRYIDFLVTGISHMEKPLLISSYIELLTQSIKYFNDSIFAIILPLTTSMTECISRLFQRQDLKGGNYQSIAQVMNGLEVLLHDSHKYLAAADKSGYTSSAVSKNDFLQTVVANVFSNDNRYEDSKIQYEREIILQSFKLVVDCCLDIWVWAHQFSKAKGSIVNFRTSGEHSFDESLHHQAYKYKFKSKKLLSTLFNMEPLEILEDLISRYSDDFTITLIHVLDGNRPALTLPYLFRSIVFRCNRSSSITFSTASSLKKANEPSLMNHLDADFILRFVIEYTTTLENAAVEDFYNDFVLFIRDVSGNYQCYQHLVPQLLRMIAIVGEKISNSKFGEQRRIKKDISDIFYKSLSNATVEETDIASSETFESLNYVCSKLQFVINELPSGDKFNNSISLIVQSAIAPHFKKKTGEVLPGYVYDLALTISKIAGRVKSWKILIGDIFHSDKKFTLLHENEKWREIIYEWSQYPDSKERLMTELIIAIGSRNSAITPAINPFNSWSESEVNIKCQNMKRISYLLLISPQNTHLLHFQSIMSQVEQHLLSSDSKIKTTCFVLLRSCLLQFSPMHFNDYWSVISYCLQTGLQRFYESLQIQQTFDPNLVLQISKSVDLLLTLNFEEFTATYEWLFIIDTMNCIYKTDPYMSLIDEISTSQIFDKSDDNEIKLATAVTGKVPLLKGVRAIKYLGQLRAFFRDLSYIHYEEMYGMKEADVESCRYDALCDLFAA